MDLGNQTKLARIVVNLALDRSFDYRIPFHLKNKIRIGSMVNVPFGHSRQVGYVISLPDESNARKLKEIHSLVGERAMLSPALIGLGKWMADYYCCTIEQSIKVMLPAVVRKQSVKTKKRRVLYLSPKINPAEILTQFNKKAPRQAALIKHLLLRKSDAQTSAIRITKVSHKAIKDLEKRGIIIVEEKTDERDPFANQTILPTPPLQLNREQKNAFNKIKERIDEPYQQAILLFGLTGSGKTEVYLQTIAECLKRGKEAIVLVPEIALTPQTVDRFRSRFGDKVRVLHSHLSDGERLDEWTRINEGRASIAIGARSAIFAPFRKLGLIIVDEEHEQSYKQDYSPQYQARDVAVMRAYRENATVVLGTATPSLESFYNVERGKYILVKLTQRIDDQALPTMEIIDMCTEATVTGRPQILSRKLVTAVRETLTAGEQVILFLNRRGYATHMQCLKCGYVASCPDCSLNLTYHQRAMQLTCHLCGHVSNAPDHCPKCDDLGIRYGGLGTEKVESVVRKVFPNIRILRMDSDTMTRKEAYREAFTAFRAGEIDLLIGTQMIAKGLHFPNVTLVGIIFADQTLNIPDFRAGERTFQLLVQVAGRAGRGKTRGRVLVQTYTPFHEVLISATRQDFEKFYNFEINNRKQLGFPPVEHYVRIIFKGNNEEKVSQLANEFSVALSSKKTIEMTISPPLPCLLLKKRGLYHYQILLSAEKITQISRSLKKIADQFKPLKEMWINIDVDPYSML